MREYHGKTQSHLQIIYRHEIENARALAKLETDESNVCLERERCFSSTKRLLGGVVEIFEESGDESDADGENGGTLKCVYIFFCFVDDDELSSSSSSSGFFFRGIGFEPNDARQKLTFRAKILALLHVQSTETKVEAAKVATVATSTLGFAQSSFAAQPEEVVGNLAGIDGRIAIFFVFAPVLGWVAYNILGPGLNQLEDMQKKNSKRRGVVGGAIGSALGASLMMQPESADAAEQVVGNLAGIDGRIAIFFVFAPVLGWVAYNILGPGLSQLEDMQKKNSRRR